MTDTSDLPAAITAFDSALPSWEFRLGRTDSGAYASCSLDGQRQGDWFFRAEAPTLAAALREVMRQALEAQAKS